MKTFNFFGTILNGSEFVLYILFPSSVILIILTYIYFNAKLLFYSFELELDDTLLDKLDNKLLDKLED
ncbi:MAG: hypothetical protein Q9M94_03770 [Candidatus Gracilibacteria bacterium]|nr:hypothetical protein [Candidatus Gracilibacteria bacterium]